MSERLYLTGNKDTDKIVLSNIENDRELLELCKTNLTIYKKVCDDDFFYNRLMKKYHETLKYKDYVKPRSYKDYYLSIIYYIDKLEKTYNVKYKGEGSPELEYKSRNLTPGNYSVYNALQWASVYGELFLIKYLLQKGYKISDEFLRFAAEGGHLKVVKYFVEKKKKRNLDINIALLFASERGHLPVVEYSVTQGADVSAYDDKPLRFASRSGRLSVVEYLIKHGANPQNGLINAARNGHLNVVKYLIGNGADIHADNNVVFKYATPMVKQYLNTLP